MNLVKGDTVYNTLTGERGIVRGVWFNKWSERTVVNVLPDGANKADWQMWQFENVSTEPLTPVMEAVQVLDEITVTSDGTDEIFATVLTVYVDTVFVCLTDFNEYHTLDKRSIVRNLTRQAETENAA